MKLQIEARQTSRSFRIHLARNKSKLWNLRSEQLSVSQTSSESIQVAMI